MSRSDLRAMVLPSGMRVVVLRLLAAIEAAETNQGVSMASQRAEGFVLGLETASALRPEAIEVMYIGFAQITENQRLRLCQT